MSCNNDKSEDSDVICLDSSQESSKCDQQEVEEEEGEVSDEVTICDKPVSFDETLPPGSAPEGFILLDESIEVVSESRGIPPEAEDCTDEPILKVIFKNEDVARKYKIKIQYFLTQLISGEAREDKNASKLILDIWPSKNRKKRRLGENGVASVTDNALFTIDNNPGSQDSLDVPTYGKKFDRVLKDAGGEPETEVKAKVSPKLNCFNCLGNHNLRDCPGPRNQMEINKNRKDFNNRNGPKPVRYHVDEDTKFEHFKPGVLSQELRKALGLIDNQLPRHIYKMRILGYPPGWLEEARLQHSGINLYNSEGLRESEPDEEQGEIFTSESRDKYDVKKVHDFPGFNIPAPSGTVDASWNVEQQEIHSKDTMLAKMSGRKVEEGYKRKKLKRSGTSQDSSCVEPAEMEVDTVEDAPVESVEVNGHFIPPIPDDSETSHDRPPPPPPPDTEEETTATDSTSRVASPSLSELENRKQKLLDSLEDSNSQSNPGTPCKSSSNVPVSNILETPNNPHKIGRVTSVELGTPILQSTSPFTKLPASEKFSKDICDVINFENLPNSTGKYEQMTEILQKVRGQFSSAPE